MQDVAVKHILQDLHRQCLALCQKETVSSVLCGFQPQGLVSFSFSQLTNELAFIAPLLLQFLATAANVDLSESGT